MQEPACICSTSATLKRAAAPGESPPRRDANGVVARIVEHVRPWDAARVGSWESRVRDVVEEFRRAGVVRGDLVGLPLRRGWVSERPRRRQDSGRSRHRGSFGGGPARGGRAPPPVGAVVERRRGAARQGRDADRDVLGRRRGASAPLRRMAGRSARVWAQLQHLALDTIPTTAPADLFGDAGRNKGDPDDPIRPDGTSDRSGWAEVGVRLRNGCGGGQNWR